MKKLIALLFMMVLLASSGGAQQSAAQQSAAPEDPPWIKEFAHKRIVYSLPGMERIKARKDVTYKRVGSAELKMDLYSPAGSGSGARRPAVIFIHGGRVPPNLRTTPKDWAVYVSFGQLVAAAGFVGVTFNHRFYAWESLSDSQSDVTDVIAYVRNNADSLGVDKDHIILWAVSAGGIFLSKPLGELPAYIRCMVAYYSALDLEPMRKQTPQTVSDETLREFSPVYHLGKNKKGPPIFVARAGLDAAQLNAGIDKFIQVALANNLTIDVANHANGHHGFDIEDDNDRSRDIIKRTLEFIKAHN
ncbi:MAG TPA: alpha/beta hydrolase [Blastocatellia bacterium]|nr:alpha/beta hydrolase [Blastocatellia bacterium]